MKEPTPARLHLITSSQHRLASSQRRIQQTQARIRVVHADPRHPPSPPEGAHAVTVKDAEGRILSYGWVAPVVDRDTFFDRIWGWAELLEARRASALPAAVDA